MIPPRSGTTSGARRLGPGPRAPLRLPGDFRAAVFDMDGLLIDSEPIWARAERDLLERRGGRFTAADAAATHGRSIDDTIRDYAARLGGVDPVALRDELLDRMRAAYAHGAPVRPGARELVLSLAGRLRLGVASNTDGDLVRLALAGAGLLAAFDTVVTARDVGASKPDPAVYLAACRALGTAPGEAVAFEDSPSGVAAAVAAGLTCIAVPDREGLDLAGAGAHVVLSSLVDVVVDPAAPSRR